MRLTKIFSEEILRMVNERRREKGKLGFMFSCKCILVIFFNKINTTLMANLGIIEVWSGIFPISKFGMAFSQFQCFGVAFSQFFLNFMWHSCV